MNWALVPGSLGHADLAVTPRGGTEASVSIPLNSGVLCSHPDPRSFYRPSSGPGQH